MMHHTSNPLIGLGLRPPYYFAAERNEIPIDWFEVHSENFFHAGGFLTHKLLKIREHYPISLHGVGLSLGSAEKPCIQHLKRLKDLINKVDPLFISEHLSWSMINNIYMPDLLPIPYNQESMSIFSENLNITQDYLQREILIENPSSYIEYHASEMSEPEFLCRLCSRTGSKILLDVNNVYVSAYNHGWNSVEYINQINPDLVREIHLAGHSVRNISTDKNIRVDTHDAVVCNQVWELYRYTMSKMGIQPTLIEWDAAFPPIDVLLGEAEKVRSYIPVVEHEPIY